MARGCGGREDTEPYGEAERGGERQEATGRQALDARYRGAADIGEREKGVEAVAPQRLYLRRASLRPVPPPQEWRWRLCRPAHPVIEWTSPSSVEVRCYFPRLRYL